MVSLVSSIVGFTCEESKKGVETQGVMLLEARDGGDQVGIHPESHGLERGELGYHWTPVTLLGKVPIFVRR